MDFLNAYWKNLIMANYHISPAVLLPYLPKGVEIDTYNDKAYISLVGFMFKNTRLFKIPIPYLGSFEEINLRFYVIRKQEGTNKRGVVFINETIPYKPVAWVANWLYKEHYVSIPTRHTLKINQEHKEIQYEWKKANRWNKIKVNACIEKQLIKKNTIEEYIFEHYYGYTKINETSSQEYRVNHPRWEINSVIDYDIDCDFGSMYGKAFKFLNNQQPSSVIVAEGSEVSVKWNRETFA